VRGLTFSLRAPSQLSLRKRSLTFIPEKVPSLAEAGLVSERDGDRPALPGSEARGLVGRAERTALPWVLTALGLAVLYASTVSKLVHVWRVDPYGGHGLFVPFYSAFILWSDRRRLATVPRRRQPAGVLVVLAALAVLWLGQWAGSLVLQGGSLVLAVAGMVLWAHGAARLRAAAFPVAFLVLMLPLPRTVVDAVTLRVQTFHAEFSSAILGLAGVPHVQQGIHIELPGAVLAVAEGCNGLRFLMALVTLAAAFAQATQRTLGRKLVLVAAAIPIAVIANGFRVSALCLAAHHVGPQAAEGLTHHSIGKTIWAFTLGVLFGVGWLLRRGGPPARATVSEPDGHLAP
jgi:exosortase